MTNVRQILFEWAEQGNLPPENLRRALRSTGALPSAAGWRHFIERLLLWIGTVMVAAGVIFFFAYNWEDLGRFAKFGLVEALIVASLVLVWRLSLERAAGKAALLAAALLVGALLALVGQIYQTGADTFELFTAWALSILPWVLLGRFPALWMLWLGIVNLAVLLYDRTFPGVFSLLGPDPSLWLLFALNTAALLVWEALDRAGVSWLRERWAPRLLATASGILITSLAVIDLVGHAHEEDWGAPVWLVWMALALFVYRRWIRDLFVLAAAVLSAIVVIASFFGDLLQLDDDATFSFLVIGLLVIGLSAAGGWWLKRVASEEGS
ncbi:MAG TPA: DUF2157 domain-containing protein [Thermoanaerobaculia bacterium]|nr:DUF2157 domain-containing protein [Thermoanaerobaculia bacterium]